MQRFLLPLGSLLVACFLITCDDLTDNPTTVFIAFPADSSIVSGTVVISVAARDDDGIDFVALRMNGDSTAIADETEPYDLLWDTAPLAPGTEHTIAARAFDIDGNFADSNPITLIIATADDTAAVGDTTLPKITIVSPADSGIVYGVVPVVCNVERADSLIWLELIVEGVAAGLADSSAPYLLAWDTSLLTGGSQHEITVRGHATTGDTVYSQALTIFISETSVPGITIASPLSGAGLNGVITIACLASSDAGVERVELWFDDDSTGVVDTVEPYELAWDLSAYAVGGMHTIVVRVYDTNGIFINSKPIAITIVDLSPPVVSIISPLDDSPVSDTVLIEIDATDDQGIERVELWIDGSNSGLVDTAEPYLLVWDATLESAGSEHELVARAFDNSGNSTDSAPVRVTIIYTFTAVLGGAGDEIGQSIVQTSDGGYLVAGSTTSSGSGMTDAWLVKVSQRGVLEWEATFGGTGDDVANDLLIDDAGNTLLVGTTSSQGGSADLWLVKVDDSGNQIWEKTYGGDDEDEGNAILADLTGGYVLVGAITVQDTGGFLNKDVFAVNVDASGNVLWSVTFGGDNDDMAYDVALAADGGFAIAGYTASFGGGGGDIWLIKLDASGTEEFNTFYGDYHGDRGQSIVTLGTGEYVIGGYTSLAGTSNIEGRLLQADMLGNEEWSQAFAGAPKIWGFSLAATSDGGFLLAGVSYESGESFSNAWLARTDSHGTEQWSMNFGGDADERLYAVQSTSDGGLIVVGYTASTGAGGLDLYVVKTDAVGTIAQ